MPCWDNFKLFRSLYCPSAQWPMYNLAPYNARRALSVRIKIFHQGLKLTYSELFFSAEKHALAIYNFYRAGISTCVCNVMWTNLSSKWSLFKIYMIQFQITWSLNRRISVRKWSPKLKVRLQDIEKYWPVCVLLCFLICDVLLISW